VVGCQPPIMMNVFTGGDGISFPSMTIPMRGSATKEIATCNYHEDTPLGRLVIILFFVYFINAKQKCNEKYAFDLINGKQKCKYFWYGIIY
jgi:hypothetical protein